MIQVRVTTDHNDPVVKVSGTPFPDIAGHLSYTFEGDVLPESFAPDTYLASTTGPIFVHHSDVPNPFQYLVKQQAVFNWAKKNIHDPAYLAYGLHGHQERAKIFHAFVVMNVMAAMHKENMLGDYWHKVEQNITVDWHEFVEHIRPSDWTKTTPDGVNYTRLGRAVGGFVTLSNWRPVQDFNTSGWALFDREYGGDGFTSEPDIRRATNILVIPPSAIPAWVHSSIQPLEPLFLWSASSYQEYLESVGSVIPINSVLTD